MNVLLLVATLQAAACAGADAGRDEASGGHSSSSSAVVPAASGGPPHARVGATDCIDAGVAPEREALGEASPARSSCTVQLTRRGDPLVIEYQIK